MTTKALRLPIYMDHNATTPVDPRVLAAMEPFLREQFGNSSSASHAYGWQAQNAVKKAREQVATLLGCDSAHVIWTSGATESNNMALLGVVRAFAGEKPHIITQATEHKAILEVCDFALEMGAEVTVLPVDKEGRVTAAQVESAIKPNTVLCSIMTANNEIGTLQPITEIAEVCRKHKVIFHTDGAQGVCKCSFDMRTLPVDMVSVSGHKIYGPKGVGALILRPSNREFELKPIMFGGEQERKLRPGTLNIAGIVGLGEACAIAQETMGEECDRLQSYQQTILKAVRARHPDVKLNGPEEERLSNNLSLSFDTVTAEDIVLGLSGIAFSSSSACTSASGKPSHVLKAIGLSDSLARTTIRLGLGRFTTASEVQTVTDKLLKLLDKPTVTGSQPKTQLL